MNYNLKMAVSDIIKTERLIIRPFTEKYITKKYVGWLNNPAVVRFSDQRHKRHTFQSCREYMGSFKKSPHYFWAIIAKDKNLGHIGNINAYVDSVHKTADLGILLGECSAWGYGYGLEAWTAVCEYLLKNGMRKITAGTLSVNVKMLRLMERAGMAPYSRRTKKCIFEGSEVDLVYGALYKKRRKTHNA